MAMTEHTICPFLDACFTYIVVAYNAIHTKEDNKQQMLPIGLKKVH
jgi:hypothetical protein